MISNINAQLKEQIKTLGLTHYKAAQKVVADTGETVQTGHDRIQRLTGNHTPKTIKDLEAVCQSLGLEVRIVPVIW